MNAQHEPLQELQHIKKMMERSTKFSSLSGFSGIAAGICALTGIWFAVQAIAAWRHGTAGNTPASREDLITRLMFIAIATFMAALICSFVFIYVRCRKLGISVFGMSARRVMTSVAIPLFLGSLFIFRLVTSEVYILIPPACLIFYGLALVNASKYTLPEVRYLGFTELFIGIINLWILGYGLIFWGLGFGLIHIIYGIIFWLKYEKKDLNLANSTNE